MFTTVHARLCPLKDWGVHAVQRTHRVLAAVHCGHTSIPETSQCTLPGMAIPCHGTVDKGIFSSKGCPSTTTRLHMRRGIEAGGKAAQRHVLRESIDGTIAATADLRATVQLAGRRFALNENRYRGSSHDCGGLILHLGLID